MFKSGDTVKSKYDNIDDQFNKYGSGKVKHQLFGRVIVDFYDGEKVVDSGKYYPSHLVKVDDEIEDGIFLTVQEFNHAATQVFDDYFAEELDGLAETNEEEAERITSLLALYGKVLRRTLFEDEIQ